MDVKWTCRVFHPPFSLALAKREVTALLCARNECVYTQFKFSGYPNHGQTFHSKPRNSASISLCMHRIHNKPPKMRQYLWLNKDGREWIIKWQQFVKFRRHFRRSSFKRRFLRNIEHCFRT